MNFVVEMIFGPESKFCVYDLEVRHQQPNKRVGGEDVEDGERELFEVVVTEIGLRS